MEHDPRNATVPPGGTIRNSCPWSFGHRHPAPPYRFRTVMSYSEPGDYGISGPLCHFDWECPLIDAYANPALEWTGPGGVQPLGTVPGAPPIGVATGWPRAHATDTLQRLAPVVAGFRPRPEAIFAHGFE